jgi:hypothetical protein
MPINVSESETSIYAAIGYALTKWAELELWLCQVFCEAVDPTPRSPLFASSSDPPAGDAFWSIISFEAKLDMTNAAVERHLGETSRARHQELLKEWTRLNKRISEKSRKRNQLAHGSIFKMNDKDGHLEVSFVPYLYKSIYGYHAVIQTPDAEGYILGSIPGERWGVARIADIARGFDVGIIRLKRFRLSLQGHNKALYVQEAETRRIFDEFHASQIDRS